MKHFYIYPLYILTVLLLWAASANAQRKQGLLLSGQANTLLVPFHFNDFSTQPISVGSHRRLGFGGSLGYYVQNNSSFAGITVSYAGYRSMIETVYDKAMKVNNGNAIGAMGLLGVRILINEHNSIDFGGGLSMTVYNLPDSANKDKQHFMVITHPNPAIGANALLNYNADLGPMHLLFGVQACYIPLWAKATWYEGTTFNYTNGGVFSFSRSWAAVNLGLFIPWQTTEPK